MKNEFEPKKYVRWQTQDYFVDENDKTEALIAHAKLPDVYLERKGTMPQSINKVLTKFYFWKNSYFNHIKTESLTGTIFVLLCITFGSGILSLPYTFKCVGIILGLILFIFSALACFWTLKLLVELAYKNNVLDYCQLVEIYYDHNVVIFTEIVNLISNLGTIVVYHQFSNYKFNISI